MSRRAADGDTGPASRPTRRRRCSRRSPVPACKGHSRPSCLRRASPRPRLAQPRCPNAHATCSTLCGAACRRRRAPVAPGCRTATFARAQPAALLPRRCPAAATLAALLAQKEAFGNWDEWADANNVTGWTAGALQPPGPPAAPLSGGGRAERGARASRCLLRAARRAPGCPLPNKATALEYCRRAGLLQLGRPPDFLPGRQPAHAVRAGWAACHAAQAADRRRPAHSSGPLLAGSTLRALAAPCCAARTRTQPLLSAPPPAATSPATPAPSATPRA